MLEEAKRLALVERSAVYVVADNERDRRRLEIECFKEGEPNLGIKFETPDSLPNLDWRTLTLRGAHPNCVVLIDHHAIEDRFAAVIAMMHRFDLPNASGQTRGQDARENTEDAPPRCL